MKLEVDMVVCLVLTVIVVLMNYTTAARALYWSFKVNDCDWLSKRYNYNCTLRILFGFFIICTILGSLKAWSIQDVFIHMWSDMPHAYHIRSYLYLGENYGVAVLGWKVTSYMIAQSMRQRDKNNGFTTELSCKNSNCPECKFLRNNPAE